MRRAGFTVKAQDVEDIQVVKTTYGLPLKLASCHTSLAGGYVLEGHIPAEVVERVLRERPKVAGLAVPGMPSDRPVWSRAVGAIRTTLSRSTNRGRPQSTNRDGSFSVLLVS